MFKINILDLLLSIKYILKETAIIYQRCFEIKIISVGRSFDTDFGKMILHGHFYH